ncbi:MAG: Activator of Hsp90 ATPase [Hyphomicrobiales bacterium]|jgi:uncharacterized protein YndB with AHSA1/START domain|nr:Activator of Hsp90 ATPase [Hyphomicrobiales bacterium]
MTTNDETTLVITRTFDAPPEQVFDAWTRREEWQAWIGPEGVPCDVLLLEAHVGGRYRLDMHVPDGTVLPVSGAFKVIDRPKTLSFTWGRDGDPSQQSLITLTFNDRDGKTELTLRQEGLNNVSERDQVDQGWNSAFNKLQRFLRQEQP